MSNRISRGTYPAGYGRFRPNNIDHHSDRRCYRGGWHRSCPVLPNPSFLGSGTAHAVRGHSGYPYRGSPHCKGFAPAAPRRAWTRVSESISGLLLSEPVPIIGLQGRYPCNYLIGRRPILERLSISAWVHSSLPGPWGISPSFPGLFPSRGQVVHVLLSSPPRAEPSRLTWLNRIPIAVASGRINRNLWRVHSPLVRFYSTADQDLSSYRGLPQIRRVCICVSDALPRSSWFLRRHRRLFSQIIYIYISFYDILYLSNSPFPRPCFPP